MKEEHVKLCELVLDTLKTSPGYSLFLGPAIDALDTETLKATYRQMITEPRDFALIRRNLENNAYAGVGSFEEDVELCFANSKRFCKLYYPTCVKLVDGTEKAFRKAIEKVHKKLEQSSAAPAAASSSSSSRKTLGRTTTTTLSPTTSFPGFEGKCEAILAGLESLAGTKWFLTPLDPASIPGYLSYVAEPMDMITIRKKLGVSSNTSSGSGHVKRYNSHNDFAYDFRTMIANFLRFNSIPSSSKLRKDVIRVLYSFETAWMKLSTEITATMSTVAFAPPVAELKELLHAVEEVLKVNSGWSMVGNAKGQAASVFMSIRANFNEDGWKRYQSAVPSPIGFGDIIGRIVTGMTTTTARAQGLAPYSLALAREDMSRMAENTQAYWTWEAQQAGSSSMSEYQMYIDDAILLRDVFLKHAVANAFPTTITTAATSSSGNSTSTATTKSIAHVAAAGGGGTKLLLKAGGSSSGVAPATTVTKHKGGGGGGSRVAQSSSGAGGGGGGGTDVRSLLQQLQSLASHPSVTAYNIPSATIDKRLAKYYREAFGEVLRRVREHYVISVFPPYPKIMTCGPFEKAVDPRAFPTYDQIITNPMNLVRMEKKNSGDKYTSVECLLNDAELIRTNAYTFNSDPSDVEVRIMADMFLHYFRYLLRHTLLQFVIKACDAASSAGVAITQAQAIDVLAALHITTPTSTTTDQDTTTSMVLSLLTESEEPESVTKFLALVETERIKAAEAAAAARAAAAAAAAAASAAAAYSTTTYMDEYAGYDQGGDDGGEVEFRPPKRHKSSGAGGRKSNTGGGVSGGMIGGEDVLYADAQGLGDGQGGLGLTLAPRPAWLTNAENVYKAVARHAFVSPEKYRGEQVAADFFHPVLEMYPQLATEYLSVVTTPMDLTTLYYMIHDQSLVNEGDFYHKLTSIFQNAVDFSSCDVPGQPAWDAEGGGNTVVRRLVTRSQHLVHYARWLCLEQLLPLTSDASSSSSGGGSGGSKSKATPPSPLTETLRDEERGKREELLKNASLLDSVAECRKLIKDLERSRNKAEAIQISYFAVPVDQNRLSDYSVYVRNPIDLSTVKARLEGCAVLGGHGNKEVSVATAQSILATATAAGGSYHTFGQLFVDLRRIFTNAITYNTKHIATDTTGISQLVLEAAGLLKDKLERLLYSFTVELADKVVRLRLINEEKNAYDGVIRQREREIADEERRFKEAEFERMKQGDEHFARDHDVDAKKSDTRKQLLAHSLAQSLRAAREGFGSMDDGDGPASMDMDIDGQEGLLAMAVSSSHADADMVASAMVMSGMATSASAARNQVVRGPDGVVVTDYTLLAATAAALQQQQQQQRPQDQQHTTQPEKHQKKTGCGYLVEGAPWCRGRTLLFLNAKERVRQTAWNRWLGLSHQRTVMVNPNTHAHNHQPTNNQHPTVTTDDPNNNRSSHVTMTDTDGRATGMSLSLGTDAVTSASESSNVVAAGQTPILTTAASSDSILAGTGHETNTPMDIADTVVVDSSTATTTTTSAPVPVRFSLVQNNHKKHLPSSSVVAGTKALYPNNKGKSGTRSLLHIHASFSNMVVDE